MSPSRIAVVLVTVLLLFSAIPHGPASVLGDLGIQIIPKPLRVARGEGQFVITPTTPVRHDERSAAAARSLRDTLRAVTGFELPVEAGGTGPAITLRLDEASSAGGHEGYRLSVSREGVVLEAEDGKGLLYGVQTLRQLLPIERIVGLPHKFTEWRLPSVTIEDRPRFPWRGLMLDCSRTFQSPDYIRKSIDRMFFYKLNVLHLHLTDDQGWRLEIRKYPELTTRGATFPARFGEPASHEGFYSQAQMRELIAYAAARNVSIVPEIEMPGHALAALSVFPELSCSGGSFEIFPFFKGPNITHDIFCAGNDETFVFLENVLAEVAGLFPSPFVHVGGDEAPKTAWKACRKCQARMAREGLKDEAELQSWFIRRVEAILERRGKRLIGWDEILEGGLAPGAAVMSWRGTKGGVAAAQAGHDIVMSPTSHCYFDYTYERIDTRRAYSFEPIPPGFDAEMSRHVLGLQANFWSHIDREPERVDYQLFPRLLAIAERGWSAADVRDWDDFSWRLKIHLAHLDQLGVRYNRTPTSSPAAARPPAAVHDGAPATAATSMPRTPRGDSPSGRSSVWPNLFASGTSR